LEAAVAYDEVLATRLRDLLGDRPGLTEKKMFGGLAILLHGNMAVGVRGDALIVRADPDQHDALMADTGARVFDLTSRPMKGWLLVDAVGYSEDDDLKRWVDRAIRYAASLKAR
jgi:TfoX/Sxy family transcriptional regulator of competence genes